MNVYTPNDIRHKLGEPPADHAWGDMVKSDADIAVQAAKGVGEILDADLGTVKKHPAPPAVGPAKPAAGHRSATTRLAASYDDENEPED